MHVKWSLKAEWVKPYGKFTQKNGSINNCSHMNEGMSISELADK